MRKSLLSMLILPGMLLAFFSGCEKNPGTDDNPPMKEIILTPVEKSLIQAGNYFALNLFRQICIQENEKPQIFLSPYNLAEALTMTYNGAAGSTSDSMAAVLGYQNMSREEINSYCKNLRNTLLKLDTKVNLSVANSIWYREQFNVNPQFIDTNREFFDAAVRGLNFSNPASKDIINDWIAEKTNDRIRGMIKEIDPEAVMFLVNAIWFKGQWASRFEKKNTTDKEFYLPDGSTVTVPFMQQQNTFRYYGNELFAMAEMPYGQGNFAMQVILPSEGKSVEAVLAEMHPGNWKQWQESLQNQELKIEFPRLKFEYEIQLNKVLSDLGMGIAFIPCEADFTGISPEGDLYIQYVQHNSFLEVNEEGTEAAAATTVSVGFTCCPEPISFIVNRPFLFAIVEKSTGAILFMGRISRPAD